MAVRLRINANIAVDEQIELRCVKQMVLELLFLFFLIAGLCALAYRGAIHEFQILHKDYDEEHNWSELLGEELPLVVRGLPKSWLGGWTYKQTHKKTWVTVVRAGTNNKKFKTTWSNWLSTPAPRPFPEESMKEIAAVSRLDHAFSNWTADGFRRWSYLPSGTPTPFVLSDPQFIGVQKATAEQTVITATDGAPLELWIAHEGAIPANVADDLAGKDPWTQTTADIPWIGEVKYVEIKLRPGNAVVLPKHWWWALRPAAPAPAQQQQQQQQQQEDAWFWVAALHTPVSWIATNLKGTKIVVT